MPEAIKVGVGVRVSAGGYIVWCHKGQYTTLTSWKRDCRFKVCFQLQSVFSAKRRVHERLYINVRHPIQCDSIVGRYIHVLLCSAVKYRGHCVQLQLKPIDTQVYSRQRCRKSSTQAEGVCCSGTV